MPTTMNLPTIDKHVPMPPRRHKGRESNHQVRQLVAQMQHGDSIVVPSRKAETYTSTMRHLGAHPRTQSLTGTGTVRIWLDTQPQS